jgi:hypothetical protein
VLVGADLAGAGVTRPRWSIPSSSEKRPPSVATILRARQMAAKPKSCERRRCGGRGGESTTLTGVLLSAECTSRRPQEWCGAIRCFYALGGRFYRDSPWTCLESRLIHA